MPRILHYVTMPLARYDHSLSFRDDYAIVCGVTPGGQMVLPACEDGDYLVPCGILGLRYKADLGTGGERRVFTFPEQLVSIVVVTLSESPPLLIPEPAPPAVTILTATFRGYTAPNPGGTQKVWELTYTDGSSSTTWQRSKRNPNPVPTGFLQGDEGNLGLIPYYGQVYPQDPSPNN